MLKVLTVLFVAILLASCTPAPTPEPTKAPPTARVTQPPPTAAPPTKAPANTNWKLIPATLQKIRVQDGWAYYVVELFLENTSTQYLSNPLVKREQGVVKTRQGVTYDAFLCSNRAVAVGSQNFGDCPQQPTQLIQEFVVPPNFRIRGGLLVNVDYQITFKAAEAATPIAVEIPSLGSIDLQKLSASDAVTNSAFAKRSLPVIDPANSTSFGKIGSPIQIKGAYEITITGVQDTGGQCYNVNARLKNLNAFNNTQTNLDVEIIYSNGWVGSSGWSSMGYQGSPLALSLGPNQVIEPRLYYGCGAEPPSYIVLWKDAQAVILLK